MGRSLQWNIKLAFDQTGNKDCYTILDRNKYPGKVIFKIMHSIDHGERLSTENT